MNVLAKPSVAWGYGAFFLCGATCAHFDELGATHFGLVSDWIAAIMLIIGGVVSGRDWLRGRQYQIVGWAFVVSLLLHSFLGNLEDLINHAPDAGGSNGLVALPLVPYLVIVGMLCVIAIGGLWTTLSASDHK